MVSDLRNFLPVRSIGTGGRTMKVHVKAYERRSPSKLNRKSKQPAARAAKPWQRKKASHLFDGF